MDKTYIQNLASGGDLIMERIRYLWEQTDFAVSLFERMTGYAIIAADFDGNIIAYNEGARDIYGYDPGEVVGVKTFDALFPKEFIKKGSLREITSRLVEEGSFSFEGEKVRKGGERFPARAMFSLTKDLNGKIVGFIEITEDITEQKRAEDKLRRELESALKGQQSLTGWQEGSITAGLAGVGPLRERSPDIFSEIQGAYETLLEGYLDALGFNERPPRKEIGDITDRIGWEGGGPRDVVDMHIRAVEAKSRHVSAGRAQAYAVEGRLLALEVMGNLVDYYRRGMKR